VWLYATALVALYTPADRRGGTVEPALSAFERSRPALGEAAPDFSLVDVAGRPFRFSAEAGRLPLVIEFGSFT
jgi:hypothetical protein